MKTTKWTPKRDELLRRLRWSTATCQEIVAAVNDGFEPKMDADQVQKRAEAIGARRLKRIVGDYNHCRPGQNEPPPAVYRAASNEFARAGHKAALRLQVVEIKPPAPPRQGIMKGKPPNHDAMIAAKVAQSAQARSAVSMVNVRGMM